jgi:uncharacterized lipoprotein YajG
MSYRDIAWMLGRGHEMRLKILTLAAAAMILAACGSSSDESADVVGGGSQSPPVTAENMMPSDAGLDR